MSDFADSGTRHPYLTGRAIRLHMTLLVVTVAFAALCWWQVMRALSGNELSWAYVFEWPLFGAYAAYMWWKLLHEPDAPPAMASARAATTAVATAASTSSENGNESGAGDADADADADAGPAPTRASEVDEKTAREDQELAAYNRYLADLGASGRRKHW